MSYISEIFDRLDLQNIREFLLHGVECMERNDKSYKQRMQDAQKPAIDFIYNKFPDQDECEKITDEIYNYAGET